MDEFCAVTTTISACVLEGVFSQMHITCVFVLFVCACAKLLYLKYTTIMPLNCDYRYVIFF